MVRNSNRKAGWEPTSLADLNLQALYAMQRVDSRSWLAGKMERVSCKVECPQGGGLVRTHNLCEFARIQDT